MPVLFVDEAVLVLEDDVQMVKSEEAQIVFADRNKLDANGAHDVFPPDVQPAPASNGQSTKTLLLRKNWDFKALAKQH